MADIKILEESVEESSSKWISYAIEGAVLAAALLLIVLLRLYIWEIVIVTSNSMQPAMSRDDRVLADHRAALQNKWQRGDIVIFETPKNWGAPDVFTKRVIGLPGEKVQVYGGQVFINDQPLEEEYIKEPMLKRENFYPLVLGSDEYFLMGDNRNNSEDSRDHGPVESRFIQGRALRILWPPGRIEKLARPVYPETAAR